MCVCVCVCVCLCVYVCVYEVSLRNMRSTHPTIAARDYQAQKPETAHSIAGGFSGRRCLDIPSGRYMHLMSSVFSVGMHGREGKCGRISAWLRE